MYTFQAFNRISGRNFSLVHDCVTAKGIKLTVAKQGTRWVRCENASNPSRHICCSSSPLFALKKCPSCSFETVMQSFLTLALGVAVAATKIKKYIKKKSSRPWLKPRRWYKQILWRLLESRPSDGSIFNRLFIRRQLSRPAITFSSPKWKEDRRCIGHYQEISSAHDNLR